MTGLNPEAKLSAPVARWLESQGYVVYSEVPRYATAIDLVGLSQDGGLVAVELKMSLSRGVRQQARLNQIVAPLSYAAVPTKPSPASIEACRKSGIGVLRVQGDTVSVVLGPTAYKSFECQARSLREALSVMTPGGIGGQPNMLGIGPAQDVYDAVQEFRGEHPEATWAQTFEAVPNHYAHVRSLQGAMRIVSEKRAARERRLAEDDSIGGAA